MVEAGFAIEIGRFKCTVFTDGKLVSQGSESPEEFGLNCLLIDSGDQKILIDTGCGEEFQSTAGLLRGNIEAAGIKCADIDEIIITHGHIDHAAGAFELNGKCVFPNARFVASEKEWEYWKTNPGTSELQSMFFGPARKNLLPIRERFDLVQDNFEVLPGIRLQDAPGHTPGLITVEISSDNKRLFCIGDVIHSPAEFSNPEHLILFDINPEQAMLTRKNILADTARAKVMVFACHFPFPGLGYIKRREGIFFWEPI
jgi:glyoxylase-like metal-dependent hydrolase (beta-lactamase superfamily II)